MTVMITRPMLAANMDVAMLTFPLLATPKIDGIRALMVDGNLVSRSFKPIPNVAIRRTLESLLPDGADGEIVCTLSGCALRAKEDGSFHETVSAVMSENKDVEFKFYWFDWAYDLNRAYEARVLTLTNYARVHVELEVHNVIPLIPEVIRDASDLDIYEKSLWNVGSKASC